MKNNRGTTVVEYVLLVCLVAAITWGLWLMPQAFVNLTLESTNNMEASSGYTEQSEGPTANESKQGCDQGRGNGSEGCDPGNSNNVNDSRDEAQTSEEN